MKAEALFETMSRQVQEDCDQTTGAARTEAERILAEARDKSVARHASAMEAVQAEKELLDLRWLQKAETEISKANLAMKKDAVIAVFHKVREEVRRIAESPGYPGLLSVLLKEVLAFAEGEIVVLAPEKHVDYVGNWLKENGYDGVRVEGSTEMWHGIAVQDPGRTYRVSNTLVGRFARVEKESRKLCMTSLFSAPREGGG